MKAKTTTAMPRITEAAANKIAGITLAKFDEFDAVVSRDEVRWAVTQVLARQYPQTAKVDKALSEAFDETYNEILDHVQTSALVVGYCLGLRAAGGR